MVRRSFAHKNDTANFPMKNPEAQKVRRSVQRPADGFNIDRILIFSAGLRAIK